MMHRVIDCLAGWMGEPVETAEVVQCHHNYTEQEEHFGKQVWLSRKGAIDASRRHAGPDPWLDGHAVLRRDGQGEPAVAELLAARRGPGVQPLGGAAQRSPAPSWRRR